MDAGVIPPADAGRAQDAGEAAEDEFACTKTVASELLPPRASVLSRTQGANTPGVFTRDLFNLFRSHCGGCHVDQGLGDLKVTLQNFPQVVTDDTLARMRSDDPEKFMPPLAAGGVPFAERRPSDPVVELATLIEAWLAAGSPTDVFYPNTQAGSDQEPFVLTREVGMAMTNLGNCVPAAKMVGTESKRSAELDALFAAATELPERLEETDLSSLDSEVLARQRVVAFAPAYTLWADEAKKVRMVRVPMGESIRFDPETQEFDVPENTRFYKTFYKVVIDHRGQERYRKIETRLVVSRQDREQPDGSYTTASLFGTYVWNDAETEAVLLRDPLRDGKPFRDRVITYITNEQAAELVVSQGPENLQQELEKQGLSRTYALPGSERCVHCHMGAPNKSFILGFTPLQLRRRPLSEGGVIEPAERDELNQLERLIAYGVISGMTSPAEVVMLEASQGQRKPRNEHELAAQGYILGNCAHCHNPRGFPSIVAPELRDALNFWPSEGGGVFAFPLDRVSPRILRGERRDIPIPYISPAIHDVPKREGVLHPDAKVIALTGCQPDGDGLQDRCFPYLYAPWRSLIYRNVDTPFSYAEDSAIFPHMPMDTPGYDCRARQLLGSWMVSIPTRFKYASFVDPTTGLEKSLREEEYSEPESKDPQPYLEILPDQPGYKQAAFAADRRLRLFRESSRYNDCPPASLDTVDPRVVSNELVVPNRTIAFPMLDAQGKPRLTGDGIPVGVYSLLVPERAHWADTDLSEAPGDWYPRRPDWDDVLVDDGDQASPASPAEAQVVELLQEVKISDAFRQLALEDVPFGLWKAKPECDLAEQKKASDFQGSDGPRWLKDNPFLDGSEAIYSISPGAMVFSSICANCHGPQGDSRGRLAATIADMTGGQTRVANLRDGFFGPPTLPGENLERIFGGIATSELDTETWAARYLLWMGLGGTQRLIPPAALSVVGSTQVLGVTRVGVSAVKDANMLSVARNLCASVLERVYLGFDAKAGFPDYAGSSLISSNGDAELWERICTFNNPLPVLTVDPKNGSNFRTGNGTLYRRERYPSEAWVGDPKRGFTKGLAQDNPAPWCMLTPTEPAVLASLQATWQAAFGASSEPPYCPDAYLSDGQSDFTSLDKERWTLRGALNAGLSVFLYLEALTQGRASVLVPYDRCEELR